jgi:DnaJ-class molecular chaperone
MSVTAGTIKCTTCRGSGEMESSDSTDGRIYKCWACDGTGKIADRRKPDPGAVSLAEVCEFLRAATYPDPACGGTRHVSGWQSAAVALERGFGGDREEGTD